ncbi:MAG: 1,4-dihydroxy-2-naphthoate octaprenyltransferase [Prosthecobacter sp.]|jgi:1,4-dihydroxy-2-naphthoate octaprenyltransferase|uniref:1,4-dihydroxy-2-naphthoate octaprenyltransferase n=1 Tax=Prosthecobacter sp. TaxID=1965333 RepID=UPI0019E11306|nr:1,4-dihydroxy-2-naphthoate octaprenyltransferase [Prosthecobacter sp.]MBE2282498.1 1,4-dihydroxy-2-naphthoate octaprenyltransferase [Prosthecobacter sp.]
MASLFDWIAAARPKTLGAAIAPVVVGSALGAKICGHFDLVLAACTLGSCVALQIATNFFNDALDSIKGADTHARIGPRRITAAGQAAAGTVKNAAWLMLLVATLLALPLFEARGLPIVFIGLPSLYFCFGYTGGPVPLAYRGLGELFVILFFGFVAVTGTAFVQTGEWYEAALVAGFQIGCLSTVLIAINNLRDVEEDRQTGKRTLAVRLGIGFARAEIVLLILAAHAAGFYWFQQGWERAFTLPLATLPIGLFVAWRVIAEPPSRGHNRLLAMSGAQLIAFSALMSWAIIKAKDVMP